MKKFSLKKRRYILFIFRFRIDNEYPKSLGICRKICKDF